jgi:tetratricopeptide (TPR) repeat protein
MLSVLIAGAVAASLNRGVPSELDSPKLPGANRYERCVELVRRNPTEALNGANQWQGQGGDGGAAHCAALALVSLGRHPEAARALDRLGHEDFGKAAERATIFDQAGNAWLLAGDTGKAIISFQAALTLSANDADLYADLARAQAMQDDWAEVEADLNAALAIQPRRADLLVLRASARETQNNFADARGDIDAALQLSPRNADAIMERGSIKRDSGDLKGARSDFQAALTLNPSAATREEAQRNLAALDAAAQPAPKPAPIKKK